MNLKDQEDKEHSSAIDNQHLKIVVEQNSYQSVPEMSQAMGSSISTISGHLKKIGKMKKLNKWFPMNSESQRIQCFEMFGAFSLELK